MYKRMILLLIISVIISTTGCIAENNPNTVSNNSDKVTLSDFYTLQYLYPLTSATGGHGNVFFDKQTELLIYDGSSGIAVYNIHELNYDLRKNLVDKYNIDLK